MEEYIPVEIPKSTKVSFENPLTNNLIENVNGSYKVVFRIINNRRVLEMHLIANVELDENNEPIYDSVVTGQMISL